MGLNGNNNKLAFNIRYIDVNNNKERWNLCFSFIDVILLLLDITLCSVVVVVVGWRLGFACSHVSLSGGFMSDDRAHGTQNRRCRVLYTSVKLVMNEYLPTSSEIFYIIFFSFFLSALLYNTHLWWWWRTIHILLLRAKI